MGREHQLFGGWLRTFSSISRIFLISCSHGWPFVLQHLATSCVVLARLDWQMDYWMEFSRSIQTIPDHSRTKGLEGCVSLPKICLTSRVSAGLPTIAGCQAAGGIANVVSFARWRKMGWVTGPRWWVVNPGGWVNLGFLIPNMNMGHDWCPHWTSPNHWVYGQCHGYFFRWCPIFPKWDSYQPQHEVFGWLLSCVFLSYSFPVQFLGCKAPLFLLTLRDIQCWLWRAMEPRRPPWILWPVVRPGCGGSFSYGLTTDLFNLFSSVSFPSFPSFLFLLLLIPFPFCLFLPYCVNCYLLLSCDPSLPLVIPLWA